MCQCFDRIFIKTGCTEYYRLNLLQHHTMLCFNRDDDNGDLLPQALHLFTSMTVVINIILGDAFIRQDQSPVGLALLPTHAQFGIIHN